jgi:hypothetical protein
MTSGNSARSRAPPHSAASRVPCLRAPRVRAGGPVGSDRPDLYLPATGAGSGEPPLAVRLGRERGPAGSAAVEAPRPARGRHARNRTPSEPTPIRAGPVDAPSLDPAQAQARAGVARRIQHERIARSGVVRAGRGPWRGWRSAARRLAGRNAPGRHGRTARRSFDPLHRGPRLERRGRFVRTRRCPLLDHPASDARLDEPPRRILGGRQRGAALPAGVEPPDLTIAEQGRGTSPPRATARPAAEERHQAGQDRQGGECGDESSIHPPRDATGAGGLGQTCCERASARRAGRSAQSFGGEGPRAVSSSAASA